MPQIVSNRQFKGAAIAAAVVAVVFLAVNILLIGGDAFVIAFNSILNPPLAIIITVLAAIVWHRMRAERRRRFLWTGLLIGWALWALAEAIWAIYIIIGQEIPYPSAADFFWLLGYIPIGIGLVARALTMPAKPTRSQNMIILGVIVVTILVAGVLIFRPIVQDFDPERLIESILNVFYPLADLFLLIIVWRLLFTYEEGEHGFVWRLLTVGFILMTASDFVYTYSTWRELYYPDSKVNVISWLFVDLPYTLSYLVWFLGLCALLILLRQQLPAAAAVRLDMVRRYGHVLVYTKNDDTIIDVSSNFGRLFGGSKVTGKSLAAALSISEQVERSIYEKIRGEGKVADVPIQVPGRSGALSKARLCGLAVFSHQKEYTGADLVVCVPAVDGSFDEALSQEARGMVRHVLDQSGSSYTAEVGQFLAGYYLPYLRSLLDAASSQGRATMSQALVDELQKTATKHNWKMRFNTTTVLDSTDYPLDLLREALPVLVETAKGFVANVTGPAFVEARMAEVGSLFSDAVHAEAAFYRRPGSEVRFADNR